MITRIDGRKRLGGIESLHQNLIVQLHEGRAHNFHPGAEISIYISGEYISR